MLLQAIDIEDGAYEAEKASRSFINKYIFPGGCLPSLRGDRGADRRAPDCARSTGTTSPRTTRRRSPRWRERFIARSGEAAVLGYDRRFRRLWELYLAYTEAGFRERRIGVAQHAAGRARLPRVAAEHAAGDRVEQERGPARGELRQRESCRPGPST